MKRFCLAVLWVAACSSGSGVVTDAGVHDSGMQGAQPYCVRSSCAAGGNYGVGFAASAPNPVCQPVDDQLTLTSDGGAVCMVKATDGGSDGGCGLQFVIAWSQTSGGESLNGVDTWDFDPSRRRPPVRHVDDARHRHQQLRRDVHDSRHAEVSVGRRS
ncbi:MAG: hypothetical protein IPJ65_38990 [Archangiaceae bacterium]|nr:hypothetical protein [Archangiaceae bacterium]